MSERHFHGKSHGRFHIDLPAAPLSVLDQIRIRLEVAYGMQANTDWPSVVEEGKRHEQEALADLVDYINSDPAHCQIGENCQPDPRTPEQIDIDLWQAETEATRRGDDPR